MIPLKLTLKNFLCYGDTAPTLDLEGIHVVCLCGQNGHGKSALLDAMTWALWGRARTRNQDELIHFGQDEMLVDLEFMARDARYRVTRRHAAAAGRRRSGSSDLQLQLQSNGGFQPITGNTIRGTQTEIDRIIGMDYETFINSAFLLQGRADEFTNKTARERKDVLAKILDLEYYDRLQERARQRATEKKGLGDALEGELVRMGQEVARAGGYRYELETVVSDLAEVEGKLASARKSRDVLKAQVTGLRTLSAELQGLERRIPDVERDLSGLEKQMDERGKRISGYRELIAEKRAVEEGVAGLESVRSRYEEMNRARDRLDTFSQRRSELERRVEGERARLEAESGQLQRQIDGDLGPKAGTLSTAEVELEAERSRLASLVDKERGLEERRERVQRMARTTGQLQAAAERFTKEGLDLKEKLRLVQVSPQDAVCPLCGAELGPDGCARLSHNYSLELEEKRGEYKENQASLKSSEKEMARQEGELAGLEASVRRDQEQAQRAVATRERELQEARDATLKLEHTTRVLSDRERQLQRGEFAAEERRQLADVEREIKALSYDAEALAPLYEEMQRLAPFREKHNRLKDALAQLPGEEESLQQAGAMSRRLREELRDARDRLESRGVELAQLPQWEAKLESAETECRGLEGRQRELSRRQGELQGQVNRIRDLEAQMDGKEAQLRALRDEESVYRELSDAFGKRGIQAMLIDTALPQLEEEANVLLGRMTDNRMHVKLETQRERRGGRGEPIETLEIKISDELGPRSYELFSGGEAFRINLALRIALSKVLAHRKGAPLPTLFIDEGFGTQDIQGRERILDVISAIEQDFEKIIVITHLEELKDAFQARIEVGERGVRLHLLDQLLVLSQPNFFLCHRLKPVFPVACGSALYVEGCGMRLECGRPRDGGRRLQQHLGDT